MRPDLPLDQEMPVIQDLPASPAPTERVAASSGTPMPPTRRWRWAVALLVVALATTATIGAGILLTGARSISAVARWAPADALVYAEVRADLPGDQRDQLAAFLSAFPGFADRSILERKLTEVYDRLLSDATKGKQTYSKDIAPWFGGQLGASILAPRDLAASPTPGSPSSQRMLLVASSTDPAKALGWFRSSVVAEGASVMPSDAGGTQLLVASVKGQAVAAAAPTGVLLVGDEASVRGALDRPGDGGLAKDADFLAAIASVPADGIASVYVHTRAYADLLSKLAPQSPSPSATDLASMLPAWSVADLRAASDALSVEAVSPSTSATRSAPDGANELPARLPASTIALLDAHAAGSTLIDALSKTPGAQQAGIEQALDRVGGLKGLLGWAGETGVVVLSTAKGPLPGLVSIATDPKAAAGLAASLSNLATVAGLKPTDTTYAGHTITTVELPVGAAGGAAVTPQPSAPSVTATAVSWTVADDLFVAGTDGAFVQAVLDVKAGASLAQAPRFTSMAGRVPSSGHAFGWLDVAAIRDAVVARMPAAEKARYQSDVAPYLAPLAGAVGVAWHDGSLERARALLILERP
ncbi:MAG TPA: DUF3352 domain-containing protein [Candidatus Dormibacteraeota bacterium]|nr:DUF3352 domain-containing protein [Candidatus Dormibacteraeota bacterium]